MKSINLRAEIITGFFPISKSTALIYFKSIVFVSCLMPMLSIIWHSISGQLGVNPIEEIIQRTGEWTLRMLILTLLVTPVYVLFCWSIATRLRRMLGLFAFFYACLHFLSYVLLDQFFDLSEIANDILKRPFITVGFLAYVGLIPLAITSSNGMMRKMGKYWKQLHKLIYMITTLGVFHFIWMAKVDVTEPVIYGVILISLLGFRRYIELRKSGNRRTGKHKIRDTQVPRS